LTGSKKRHTVINENIRCKGADGLRLAGAKILVIKPERKEKTMKLKVASVQMVSENGNVSKNILHAKELIQEAIFKGAKLILIPEFALIGYEYSDSIWSVSEPVKGWTYNLIKEICIENDVYIGTCILERDGNDFYDTFILTGPSPSDFWSHRKIEPASYEAFFIKGGGITKDVFETPIGKIGVAICLDSTKSHTLKSLAAGKPELLLIPFSYPAFPDFYPSSARKAWKEGFEKIPQIYATALHVPVVSCNKTGKFESPVPMMFNMRTCSQFLDTSQILDCEGTVAEKAKHGEQVLIGEVEVKAQTGTPNTPDEKRWLLPFSAFVRFTTDTSYRLGKIRYAVSAKRKAFINSN